MKIKTETVHTVDYSEFDRFIMQEYGITRRWTIVADQEGKNDSTIELTAEEGEEVDEYDKEQIEKFRGTGNGSFIAQALLQDCANRGLIPFGTYIVRVSW